MNLALRRWMCRSLLLGLPLLAAPALAQEIESLNTGTAAAKESPQKVALAVTFGGADQFNTDIDRGGTFNLFRGRVGADLGVRLNDSLVWDTTLKYQFDAYGFNKTFDPWGTINTLQPTTLLKWQVDEKWMFYGGPTFRFSVEDSTDLGRGFTAGGIAGFNYAANDKLTVGAGLAYVGQIEDSSKVVPIVTANWKFKEEWRLTAGFFDVATAGLGAEVGYAIAPKWDVSAGAQYHKARFRLNPSGSIPEGIGQESSVNIYVRAGWTASEHVKLSAFAGVVAGGNLRVEDEHGHKLADNDYDTTGMAGGAVTFTF